MKKRIKNYHKQNKNNSKTKLLEKKHINSKFKHRGSAAVELLKKQINLEKRHLTHTTRTILQEFEEEIESEEDEFQNLVNELNSTAKKQPSFKEPPVILLINKFKRSKTTKEKNQKYNQLSTNIQSASVKRITPPSNRFKEHLQYELKPEDVENLLTDNVEKYKECFIWPEVGQIFLEEPNVSNYEKMERVLEPPSALAISQDLENIGVLPSLARKAPLPLNGVQSELFSLINVYKDLYYPHRSLENGEAIRLVYTLHAFHHILKTRACVMLNNKKFEEATANKESKKDLLVTDNEDIYRDQGLARPKVLILVPFRDSAYRIVSLMADMIKKKAVATTAQLESEQNTVMNYERFVNEFTGNALYFPKTNPKPEDYEKTFSGNTDDNFRLGLSLTKKTLKLYTDFHASDILIASPLGLRMTIAGGQKRGDGSVDKEVNYDFLTSIEVLIIDQAELILAQNWENVVHIMEHLHLQPKSLHTTNITRVRSWCLSGLSKFYRQSLIFASHELPEFRGLFHNKCYNYEGRVRISNPISHGDIHNVVVPLHHQFHRININNVGVEQVFDVRFQYFITKILPEFRNTIFAHTMIYVPNYFDYVRLRNYFKMENLNFVQICEYTKKEKMARARDMFFHSSVHFLLYSERSHFFKRTRIKGIRHLIMYQPPLFPHFYAEMVNLMHTSNQNARDGLADSMSITVLYTKYDQMQLNYVLGSEYTASLLASDKTVHVYAPHTT